MKTDDEMRRDFVKADKTKTPEQRRDFLMKCYDMPDLKPFIDEMYLEITKSTSGKWPDGDGRIINTIIAYEYPDIGKPMQYP